jgi:flagellar biosynthesis/type III secretory pathway ATPase
MPKLVDARHLDAASRVRAHLAVYEEHRDLITLGAYHAGRDRQVDAAVAAYPAIEKLLRQRRDETADWDRALAQLLDLAR